MEENKIVKRETKQMRIGDILDHPLNPKTYPDYQIQAIDASIDEIGKFDNPKAYYSERNGGKLTLFHGHGRKQRNQDDIWEIDIYPDYTDEQADKAILYGDPTVGLAIKDHEFHEQLKREIATDSEILHRVMDENGFDYSIDAEGVTDEFSLKDGDREPFQQMTFTFADKQAELVRNAITDVKKQVEFDYCETFQNKNSNGNALYYIVSQWISRQ